MAMILYIRIATVGNTIQTVNSPMYDTHMSTPGNTAKVGTAHSNIQTGQHKEVHPLVGSEPTMHLVCKTTESSTLPTIPAKHKKMQGLHPRESRAGPVRKPLGHTTQSIGVMFCHYSPLAHAAAGPLVCLLRISCLLHPVLGAGAGIPTQSCEKTFYPEGVGCILLEFAGFLPHSTPVGFSPAEASSVYSCAAAAVAAAVAK